MKEQLQLSQSREEQLNLNLENYIDRHQENQTIIEVQYFKLNSQQQTLEYKNLQKKFSNLFNRIDNGDQEQKYLKNQYLSRQINLSNSLNQSVDEQKGFMFPSNSRRGSNKLNLDFKSAQKQKESLQSRNLHQQQSDRTSEQAYDSKRALINCLDELSRPNEIKSAKPRNSRIISFDPQKHSSEDENKEEQLQSKKKQSRTKQNSNQEYLYSELDKSLKQLNEKYELLIKTAQQETDFKKKAGIRQELLSLTEQIKKSNNEIYLLKSSRS